MRPHVPLHFTAYFQTLCSQAGCFFFFFFEMQLFYENSCNYFCGSGGMLESAQRRCLPYRW